jgi:hypothetical protein
MRITMSASFKIYLFVVIMFVIGAMLSLSGCSFFQAVGPQACEYADTICATANSLCSLLDNPASTSAQIDSAKAAFLGSVQTVTAVANNKSFQLRKAGK